MINMGGGGMWLCFIQHPVRDTTWSSNDDVDYGEKGVGVAEYIEITEKIPSQRGILI